jgi:hypothetical protein
MERWKENLRTNVKGLVRKGNIRFVKTSPVLLPNLLKHFHKIGSILRRLAPAFS